MYWSVRLCTWLCTCVYTFAWTLSPVVENVREQVHVQGHLEIVFADRFCFFFFAYCWDVYACIQKGKRWPK